MQTFALLQVNPDITSHDTFFLPFDYVGGVISQQFDLIFNFLFFLILG